VVDRNKDGHFREERKASRRGTLDGHRPRKKELVARRDEGCARGEPGFGEKGVSLRVASSRRVNLLGGQS